MDAKLFSGCGVTANIPAAGHRCQFCGERMPRELTAYQFARIDPRAMAIEFEIDGKK